MKYIIESLIKLMNHLKKVKFMKLFNGQMTNYNIYN